MLSQVYNFFAAMYGTTVTPIGWIFIGMLVVGGALLFLCARANVGNVVWISIILIAIPLICLVTGILFVVCCWIVFSEQFNFTPESIVIALLLVSGFSFLVARNLPLAIFRRLNRRLSLMTKAGRAIRLTEKAAGYITIISFLGFIGCCVMYNINKG